MQPVLTLMVWGYLIAVPAYSTMIYLAAGITIASAMVIPIRRGLPWRKVVLALIATALAIPVGARLLYAITHPQLYFDQPGQLWDLGFGDYSLYGGTLLSLIVGFMVCRGLKLDPVRLVDGVTPALGVGVAVARMGCFLAGCCFGKETDLPWGVVFPTASSAHLHQILTVGNFFPTAPQAVHPTQLYELSAGLIAAGLATWLLRQKAPDGVAFLTAAGWFSAFRFVNYFLRVQPATQTAPVWFEPALYGIAVMLCGWQLWVRSTEKRNEPQNTQPRCCGASRPIVMSETVVTKETRKGID